jgi:hypothetical protein
MCDPVLIAAILEELGYFDVKKENDEKDEIHGKPSEDHSKPSGEEEK